jgi:hypothetical protein
LNLHLSAVHKSHHCDVEATFLLQRQFGLPPPNSRQSEPVRRIESIITTHDPTFTTIEGRQTRLKLRGCGHIRDAHSVRTSLRQDEQSARQHLRRSSRILSLDHHLNEHLDLLSFIFIFIIETDLTSTLQCLWHGPGVPMPMPIQFDRVLQNIVESANHLAIWMYNRIHP